MLATDAAVPIMVKGSAIITTAKCLLVIEVVENKARLRGTGFWVQSMLHSHLQGASHVQGGLAYIARRNGNSRTPKSLTSFQILYQIGLIARV